MNNVQKQSSHEAETTVVSEPPLLPSPNNQDGPEIETLRAENDRLKSSIRMLDARRVLMRSLTDAGGRSPELLFAAAKDDLQFTDEGELQNAAAIVEHLKRSYPDNFGPAKPSASIDAGAGTLAPAQLITADSLSKMTPEQIQKLNWDDVKRTISQR